MGVGTVVLIFVVYIKIQVALQSITKRSLQVGLDLCEPTIMCLPSSWLICKDHMKPDVTHTPPRSTTIKAFPGQTELKQLLTDL